VKDIAALIEDIKTDSPTKPGEGRDLVLWLGNSQLHTINQFRKGDHLAPYWLLTLMDCGGCILPLGVSLPSANFQEFYVLAHTFSKRLPLSLVIIQLVFETLREDGLRNNFEVLLNSDSGIRAEISRGEVGQEILRAWDARNKSGDEPQETAALRGFGQKNIETALSGGGWTDYFRSGPTVLTFVTTCLLTCSICETGCLALSRQRCARRLSPDTQGT